MLGEDNMDIKMEVITGLEKVLPVVGPEILTQPLLLKLSEVTKNGGWRLREAAFELLG